MEFHGIMAAAKQGGSPLPVRRLLGNLAAF
jgi:hypothetical protein